mgnify:CR=1 FL=1
MCDFFQQIRTFVDQCLCPTAQHFFNIVLCSRPVEVESEFSEILDFAGRELLAWLCLVAVAAPAAAVAARFRHVLVDELEDAGIATEAEDRERIGTMMGTALGGVGYAEEQLGHFLRG